MESYNLNKVEDISIEEDNILQLVRIYNIFKLNILCVPSNFDHRFNQLSDLIDTNLVYNSIKHM